MCNTPPDAAALCGRILALLEAATEGALTDAAKAAYLAAPAEHLAGIAVAATAMSPRLQMMLDAAIAGLERVPGALSAAGQSQAWLVYAKTRAALGRNADSARPDKHAWAMVDWSLPDAEIARRMGVGRSAVLRQRRKRAG